MKFTVPWILFSILLVLKLTGLTVISWWWVTFPLWATLALIIVCFLVICLVGGIVKACAELSK